MAYATSWSLTLSPEVVLCESDVRFCRVVVFACNGGLVDY